MKCTALLACEKIIIDKDGAHTIINVMLNAAIALQEQQPGQPPEEVSIPTDAVMPHTWWIYSLWKPSLDDVGRPFEQVYQIWWPKGDKLAENRIPFVQKDDRMQQTSFYLTGFPVGKEGDIRIISWLDSLGHRVTDIVETSVRVEHKKPGEGGPTTP